MGRADLYRAAVREIEESGMEIDPSPDFPEVRIPNFQVGYSSLSEFLTSEECKAGEELLKATGIRIILAQSRRVSDPLILGTIIFFGEDGLCTAECNLNGEWITHVLSADDIRSRSIVERIYTSGCTPPEEIVPFILKKLDGLAKSVWS